MANSKPKRDRIKQQREGGLNPEISRQQWHRKPQTLIVRNEKAEQRRRACRKGTRDDAVFLLVPTFDKLYEFDGTALPN